MRSGVRSAHDPLRPEWAALAALAVSLCAVPALAEPPATSPACTKDGAQPPPAQSECVARAEPEGENVVLLLPRAVLAIPRLVFRTATELLTLGTEIEDHYDFADRMRVVESAPQFRIFPSVRYDTVN